MYWFALLRETGYTHRRLLSETAHAVTEAGRPLGSARGALEAPEVPVPIPWKQQRPGVPGPPPPVGEASWWRAIRFPRSSIHLSPKTPEQPVTRCPVPQPG